MFDDESRERQFARAASEFCLLVEEYPRFGSDGSTRWLQKVGEIMLTLDQLMASFEQTDGQADYSMLQDLPCRFKLYQDLKQFIGSMDDYWSEGDLAAGDGLKTGSLADDITDTYFDIRRGLKLYTSGVNRQADAFRLWAYSYRVHWQQHIRDATRQLFEFRTFE